METSWVLLGLACFFDLNKVYLPTYLPNYLPKYPNTETATLYIKFIASIAIKQLRRVIFDLDNTDQNK